jgi:uncharacterized protein (TIGR00369 family)
MADGGEAETSWKMKPVTSGEWVGWNAYGGDPFEDLTGPFYMREEADGGIVCAFRAERRHMNGSGFMHGGCLATFADYALFIIGREALAAGGSVTASLNAEFVDSAREGELIEARGEVVRAGGSMVFMRGLVSTGGRPLLNFSAIVKKIRRR